MPYQRMSPVLKWAGGKTQILDILEENMPVRYNRYFEPFIGSAAVLLHFAPSDAVINDINEQLINLYRQLKTNVEDVIKAVEELDATPCNEEVYYSFRELYNVKLATGTLDAECAGLMIWINKHCFNGLYRVNRKGLFNVPYNKSTRQKSIDKSNLRAISDYLRGNEIKIMCADFEAACEDAASGDFVYFDSPYVPVSETASFTDYTMQSFGYGEHILHNTECIYLTDADISPASELFPFRFIGSRRQNSNLKILDFTGLKHKLPALVFCYGYRARLFRTVCADVKFLSDSFLYRNSVCLHIHAFFLYLPRPRNSMKPRSRSN